MSLQSLKDLARQLVRYSTTGWRRKALIVFFVLLTLAVIAQILFANRDVLLTYEWNIRPVWLVYALLFFSADFLVSLWAWHILVVNLVGFNNLRLTAKIVLTSNLARRIPGPVWHITSRALMYGEQGISRRSITLLSGLEMAFFFISAIVVFLLTLPFWVLPAEMTGNQDPVWLLAIALPVGLLLVHPRLLQRVWQRMSRESVERQLQWRDTVVWLGFYGMTWVLGGGVLFSVINFFEPLAWSEFVAVTGIWSLAGIVSITGFLTVSFIGLREISLVFLLTPIVPHPITLLIAISIRLIWVTGELLTSLLSLRL